MLLKTPLGTAENLDLGLATSTKVALPAEEAGVEHWGFEIKAELRS